MTKTFILGGTRSGKSRYAEELSTMQNKQKIYLATAEARDAEMQERIAHHRNQRGDGWQTIEEPLDIAAIIADPQYSAGCILVDCLTLWLSNLMEAGREIEAEFDALIGAVSASSAELVIVSNEVGLGIVPIEAGVRAYRDHAGRLHQQIAAASDRVVFMAAGLPMRLKG